LTRKQKTMIAYGGIVAVVLIWAISPIIKKTFIGGCYSASIYSAVVGFSSAVALLLINLKNLKKLNHGYFKIAVPTGISLGIASLAQALAYNFNASPTNQAFLENLSCVAVPFILFLAVKKRPSLLTVSAAAVCLVSSMVLSGVFGSSFAFHTSDILNAFAGVMYGVNIAFTGIYAKKVSASLYVMIQQFVQSLLAFVMAIAFNYIRIGSEPIDKFVFTFDVRLILILVAVGIVANAMCWTVRTSAMKYVSANAVAVIMPFSSVLTGIFAIAMGQDKLSASLVIGAVLGLAACLMSAFDDIKESKKNSKKQ